MQLNLDRKHLGIAFLLCLSFTLAVPLLPFLSRISFFSPFLIITLYKRSLASSLWYAFGCGIVLDLLCSSSRFGIYSLDFCISIAAIHPLKRYFFADSLTTLPIMTYLFSVVSAVVMAILLSSIEAQTIIALSWFLTDVLFMPAADAVYGFAAFTLPALLVGKRIRSGKEYFLSRSE